MNEQANKQTNKQTINQTNINLKNYERWIISNLVKLGWNMATSDSLPISVTLFVKPIDTSLFPCANFSCHDQCIQQQLWLIDDCMQQRVLSPGEY